MGQFLKFSSAEHGVAKAQAAERQLHEARRRAYLGALARQTFVSRARQEGIEVSLEGAYSVDADLAELLDIADVRVGQRRVDVVAVYSAADSYLRADRRAIAAGMHADAYVFVELDADLRGGRVVGCVPLEAFLERSWVDRDGDHLAVDAEELLEPAALEAILAGPSPIPDRVEPESHDAVFETIAVFEAGQLPVEDRGPFESHLYACAECRRELVRVRLFRNLLVSHPEATPVASAPRTGNILAFRQPSLHRPPSRPFRPLREALALIAADEEEVFRLETADGQAIDLVVPNEAACPRLDEAGIKGVLLFRDASWAGRQIRGQLLLEADDGVRAEPWMWVVQGRKLVLSGGLPEAFQAYLRDQGAGEALALRPEWLLIEPAGE